MQDDLRQRMSNLEKSISLLLSTSQMSPNEIKRFLDNSSNLDQLQRAMLVTEKECTWFKQHIYEKELNSRLSETRLADAKDRELRQLQEKLSQASSRVASSQSEIAELKHSISILEAQSAQLTVENLKLRSQVGDSELDASHTDSLVEALRQKTIELSSSLTTCQRDLDVQTKRASDCDALKQRLAQVQTTLVQREKALVESQRIVSELQSDHLRSENRIRDLTRKTQEIESEKQAMVDGVAFSRLQEEVRSLRIQNEAFAERVQENDQSQQRLSKSEAKLFESEQARVAFAIRIHQRLTAFGAQTERYFGEISSLVEGISLREFSETVEKLIMVGTTWRRRYDFMLRTHSQNERSLDYAIQAMAKLAGVSNISTPKATAVIDNPELLEEYFEYLRSNPHHQDRVRGIRLLTPPARRSTVSSTLNSINDLMTVMNEQMQEEHEDLMTTLSASGFRSFRSSRG